MLHRTHYTNFPSSQHHHGKEKRTEQCKSKRKKYSEEDMKNALREISEGSSAYLASKRHNIPKSTLCQRRNMKGNVKQGNKLLFSPKTEQEIADRIVLSTKQGPISRRKILAEAHRIRQKITGDKNVDSPSGSWLKLFLKRNQSISTILSQTKLQNSACFLKTGKSKETKDSQTKRKKYSTEDMNKALKEVSEGSSVYSASKRHNIPKSTLCQRRHMKGDVKKGKKFMFSPKTEQEIANWIVKTAKCSGPVARKQILEKVRRIRQKITGDKNVDAPSKKWLQFFIVRNESLSSFIAQPKLRSSVLQTEEFEQSS